MSLSVFVRVGHCFQTASCLQLSAFSAAMGQAKQHRVSFGPLSSGLCAFISMFCSHSCSQRSASWVKTYSNALSGQLIMDFDYSHFAVLKVAPLPEGGPAERPAPLIVSVFGPNWTKWERVLPKFALLLCLHADSPERHSLADSLKNSCRRAHKNTSTSLQMTLPSCSHIDEVLNFSGARTQPQLRPT